LVAKAFFIYFVDKSKSFSKKYYSQLTNLASHDEMFVGNLLNVSEHLCVSPDSNVLAIRPPITSIIRKEKDSLSSITMDT